ncbi:unnamed protein product [Closterium sp. NIES-65]|nr:unnamed protein product [Closterium sp. NIES-65]
MIRKASRRQIRKASLTANQAMLLDRVWWYPLPETPETQGLVVALVYLVVTILFQHFYFTPDSPWLLEYNAALACICYMAFLGFIDDVLDIPWRVKLILPSIAALPLLMAYSGHTTIVIPKPLRPLLAGLAGEEVAVWDLGVLYKVYMGMLVVFCSNSINILAGVNGLEAGQTAVIAAAVLLFNIWQIGELPGLKLPLQPDMQQAHLFSIYLILPLLACTLALLVFNWYPSQVFVGDTFTYFAGMTLAVVGILGHFSETLLLLFLPQVINFIYSIPQLFKFVPCPRHRLPKFDPATHRLTGSSDLNLVNLFLRLFGPCTEEHLCIRLLLFQVLPALPGTPCPFRYSLPFQVLPAVPGTPCRSRYSLPFQVPRALSGAPLAALANVAVTGPFALLCFTLLTPFVFAPLFPLPPGAHLSRRAFSCRWSLSLLSLPLVRCRYSLLSFASLPALSFKGGTNEAVHSNYTTL